MVNKIRIVSRDEDEITVVLKDGEYSGKYRVLGLHDGNIFERVYYSHNNMHVETERAQYIAAALVGVIKSKI